jgi:hypothetical protein
VIANYFLADGSLIFPSIQLTSDRGDMSLDTLIAPGIAIESSGVIVAHQMLSAVYVRSRGGVALRVWAGVSYL